MFTAAGCVILYYIMSLYIILCMRYIGSFYPTPNVLATFVCVCVRACVRACVWMGGITCHTKGREATMCTWQDRRNRVPVGVHR